MTHAETVRWLLADVGNTRVKFGVFASPPSPVTHLPHCLHFVAGRTRDPLPWDELRSVWAPQPDSVSVVCGSNAAQIVRVCREWPADWPAPQVWDERGTLPIEMDVDFPEKVGFDRLLNGIAANVLRRPEQPAFVIDIGTATTVDAVSGSGVFVGGAILAGPELCARALHEHTSALPLVAIEDCDRRDPAALGRNTEDAILSGLYWGHWHAVSLLSVRLMSELDCPPPEPCGILTGGAARPFVHRLPPAMSYEPHLTLQGLCVAVGVQQGGA